MRASKSKQLLLNRELLLPNLMLIQIPPRIPQLSGQLIRHPLIPQYQPQQMPLETVRLIIHKRVPRMHHAEIVEEDHVAGFEDDFCGVPHGGVVEGVEGAALEGGEGGEGGRAWGGGGAGDAGAGAVD